VSPLDSSLSRVSNVYTNFYYYYLIQLKFLKLTLMNIQISMFCPAMCSGKGICDWSLAKPACQCFDPSDTTEGCYESKPAEPDICPNIPNSSVLAFTISLFLVFAVTFLISWKLMKRRKFTRLATEQ
jgi:hypothetical protein